jgi:hypothetical protein
MTERDFYKKYLRPALYNPPRTQVYRVEDYGMTDVIVVRQGDTFFLELKVLEHLPVRAGTTFKLKYTPEQLRTVSQINETQRAVDYECGPRAFFLVAVAKERRWFLFTHEAPPEMDNPYEYAWNTGMFDELNTIL